MPRGRWGHSWEQSLRCHPLSQSCSIPRTLSPPPLWLVRTLQLEGAKTSMLPLPAQCLGQQVGWTYLVSGFKGF